VNKLAKSNPKMQKLSRKPGRPKVIKDELRRVTLWLPVSDIERIDAIIGEVGAVYKDRSDFLREVIGRAVWRDVADLLKERAQAKMIELRDALSSVPVAKGYSKEPHTSDSVERVETPEYLAAISAIVRSFAKAWTENREEANSVLLARAGKLIGTALPEAITHYTASQLETFLGPASLTWPFLLAWRDSGIEALQPVASQLIDQSKEAFKLVRYRHRFSGPLETDLDEPSAATAPIRRTLRSN
jgi:hypothetical protein